MSTNQTITSNASGNAVALIVGSLHAQQETEEPDAQKPLTVERIFDSKEFAPESLGRFRWLRDKAAYTVYEQEEKDDEKDDDGDRDGELQQIDDEPIQVEHSQAS